jgi:GTP1/Obg family GTP-binding protein
MLVCSIFREPNKYNEIMVFYGEIFKNLKNVDNYKNSLNLLKTALNQIVFDLLSFVGL